MGILADSPLTPGAPIPVATCDSTAAKQSAIVIQRAIVDHNRTGARVGNGASAAGRVITQCALRNRKCSATCVLNATPGDNRALPSRTQWSSQRCSLSQPWSDCIYG